MFQNGSMINLEIILFRRNQNSNTREVRSGKGNIVNLTDIFVNNANYDYESISSISQWEGERIYIYIDR